MIEAAFARLLAANVTSLTFSETDATGNVFLHYMPSTPDVAVMLMVVGGQPQMTNLPTDLPQLQAIVRGGQYGFRAGAALAYTVYSELACLDLITLAEDTVDELFIIGCTAAQSAPVALGVDDNQRPSWSLNFDLRIPSTTTHRQPVGA